MNVQAGDILLYKNPPTFATKAEVFGEHLEDPLQDQYYYHVAIAVSSTQKVEANGKDVGYAPIDFDRTFDVFRLPESMGNVQEAISYVEAFVGEKYDWTLIVEDVLSYATFDVVNLPKTVLEHTESTEKICSTLGQLYAIKRGVQSKKKYDSPEDLYIDIKDIATKNPA